jgi:hypothetical protein
MIIMDGGEPGWDEDEEPEEDDALEEVTLPGPCCACGREGLLLRNIMMLHVRAPIDGTGWGCVACSLESNGAVAAVCDACVEAQAEVRWACLGYPAGGERVPVEQLTEPWEHDMALHPEEEGDT